MPSPTQKFFEELADLSFVDTAYKKRFMEELQDHIEDSIHDADVHGIADTAAETETIKKLGSPKHLQKNFNRMLKPQRTRTIITLLLQFFATLFISYIALIPFGGIASTLLNIVNYLLGKPHTLDLTYFWDSAVFVIIGVGFLGLFQISVFQSALIIVLERVMKPQRFWLMYGLFVGTPLFTLFIIQGAQLSSGAVNALSRNDLIHLIIQYSIVTIILFAFLTICFTFAAFGVIARLQGSSLLLRIARYTPKNIRKPLESVLKRYAFTTHLSLINIVGFLSVCYVLFWLLVSFSPNMQHTIATEGLFSLGGTEPHLWSIIFILPMLIITALQTMIISLAFSLLSPIYGIWLAGLFYFVIVLLCIIVILFSVWTQKIQQSIWLALCFGLICGMTLSQRLPSDSWLTINSDIQWQRPVENLSVEMDKKIFGPFYRLYNSSVLFAPIPSSQIIVNAEEGLFNIQTALGSSFVLDESSATLQLIHRQNAQTINAVHDGLRNAIPKELEERIYCGEKLIHKKTDLYVDDIPAYSCTSIRIDDNLLAEGEAMMLIDIAVNAENSIALIVILDEGRHQLYRVSLK